MSAPPTLRPFHPAGSPNLTAVDGPSFAGSATIDFSDLWPVITVGGGASLRLENLVLEGLQSTYSPEVAHAQPGLTRVRGLVPWPTIDAQSGAEVGDPGGTASAVLMAA